MGDASQDSCYPIRFPEYPRLSPQSVVDTDNSDATVDETYCAICLRAFEDGEESSSDNSIAFSPWEGLEEEARTESPDSQSDSELDEDYEIGEDYGFDQEPKGTGVEEIGKLVNGDMCDLTNVWGKMGSIDMNNDEAVASLIRNMTSERERESLEFTAKDEADILATSGAFPDKVNSDGPSELTFPSFCK
jgi:hypothetical protein